MFTFARIAALSLLSIVGACSSVATRQVPIDTATAVSPAVVDSTPALPGAADRQAILAMAGGYRVEFAFEETVVLADGYQRSEPKRSGAYEAVIVVEDSPQRIVLQHILVSRGGAHVTKHWRQDWQWQADERFEFSADQTWRLRPIEAAKTAGAWTQCVYEVSDAPRYCGTGKWNHRYGVATWTSDRSWRPLPRREYAARSDYNALNVENRHTVVPGGWTHEQDNTKTLRAAGGSSRSIVREFGFNDYTRADDFDFQPAHDYWAQTGDYWARVRERWTQRIQANGGVFLDMPVDGMPLIEATFAQAEQVASGEAVSDAALEALFDRYIKAPGNPVAARR